MNIEKIREDIIDYNEKLFLNSAGASLMPKSVLKCITKYLQEEEKYGGYEIEEKRSKEIEMFYLQTAQLINAQPQNIAYTSDATTSYIKALSSIPFETNDVILTTDDDYASNHIQFLSLQKRHGVKIKRIKVLENGDLDLSNLEALINKYSPKLVAVTHVPTNSGLIQQAEQIGEICDKSDILFLLDACQSVGQFNVNVQKIKCDFLTGTGRKFLRGPRGTGFLYASDKILNASYHPLFIDGRGAKWTSKEGFEILPSAKRFETWERSCALKVGLTEAIRYLHEIGMNNIESYNSKLIDRLRANLSSISDVNMFDKGTHKCNLLTFNKNNKSLELITSKLRSHHVYFSVSHKAWGLIDFDKKGIDWAIRLSPHYFNTFEEIDKVSEIIETI